MKIEYFRLGQKAYTLAYGKGVVDRISSHSMYSIIVKFSDDLRLSFTDDGRLYGDEDIVLFQKPVSMPINKPLKPLT